MVASPCSAAVSNSCGSSYSVAASVSGSAATARSGVGEGTSSEAAEAWCDVCLLTQAPVPVNYEVNLQIIGSPHAPALPHASRSKHQKPPQKGRQYQQQAPRFHPGSAQLSWLNFHRRVRRRPLAEAPSLQQATKTTFRLMLWILLSWVGVKNKRGLDVISRRKRRGVERREVKGEDRGGGGGEGWKG